MPPPGPEPVRGACGPAELRLEAETVPRPAPRAPWPLRARYSCGPLPRGAALRAAVVWDVALGAVEEPLAEVAIPAAGAEGELLLRLPLDARPVHEVTNVNALVFTLRPAPEPAPGPAPEGPEREARAAFFFNCAFTERGGLTIQFYPS